MPFFSRGCYTKKTKKLKNVTLQVRISQSKKQRCGKRVFSSISGSQSGSMTVEASLVLPLFLFASIIMMMPFSIMNRERQVQAVLESVAEDISQMAYIQAEGGQAVWVTYAQVQIRAKLVPLKVKGLSLLGSNILEDGETVHLVAEYRLPLPFPVFRMESVTRVSQSYRRAWVGKEGGRLGGAGLEEGDNTIVYIGKNSTRYHGSRTCHYLENQLTRVSLADISQHQNAGGGRYKPCSRCAHGAAGMVYIMPGGESYHSTISCSAIVAYIKAVKKSTVEHLGACSYCGGG